MAADLDRYPLQEFGFGALLPDSFPEKGPREAIQS